MGLRDGEPHSGPVLFTLLGHKSMAKVTLEVESQGKAGDTSLGNIKPARFEFLQGHIKKAHESSTP